MCVGRGVRLLPRPERAECACTESGPTVVSRFRLTAVCSQQSVACWPTIITPLGSLPSRHAWIYVP